MNTFAETSTNGSTGVAVACGVRGNQIATTAHTRNEATGTAYRGRRRRTALSAHTRAVATAAAGKKMAARSSSGPKRRTANHSHGATARSSGHAQRRRTGGAAWARCLRVSVSITPIFSNTSSSGACPGGPSAPSSSSSQALFARPGTCLIPLGSQAPTGLRLLRGPGLGWGQLSLGRNHGGRLSLTPYSEVPRVRVDLLPRSN